MPGRIRQHLLLSRRDASASRGRRSEDAGRGACPACGQSLAADDHAVLFAGRLHHAGCVLYRPRPVPAPTGADPATDLGPVSKLQRTR